MKSIPNHRANEAAAMHSGSSPRPGGGPDHAASGDCNGRHRPKRRRTHAAMAIFSMGVLMSAPMAPAATPAPPKPPSGVEPAAADRLLNGVLRGQSDAFNAWDIGGELRLRYDSKDSAGPYPSNDFITRGKVNSNDELSQRLRVHLGYSPAPWLKAYVEGRGSFAQRDVRNPSPDSDRADLQLAYLEIGDLTQFPLVAQLGRQELVYGDQHFIGLGDWGNVARSFDAARLRYDTGDLWIDALAARVVVPYDNHFNLSNDYDNFFGLYASANKLIPWQETQLYLLLRDASSKASNATAAGVPGTPTTAREIYTLGTRWASVPGKLGGWDYSVEAALQFGSIVQSNVRREQQAYAVFASGAYTFKDTCWTPRLGFGYDFGSGDSNPTDGKSQTFENLFGTLHRYYGAMDLLSERNMQIPRLSASVKPTKQLTLSTEYLMFWLVNTNDALYPESGSGRKGNGYGIHPGFNNFVGSEMDLIATYSFNPSCELQVGCGHFFAGEYIKQAVGSVPANGGARDANWFYTLLRLRF